MDMLFMTLSSEETISVPNPMKKILLSGDSTITSQVCRSQTIASQMFSPSEISDGYSADNIAVGGHTIQNQRDVWASLSDKVQYDVIIIQIGLNDMNENIATTLTRYQGYVNYINQTKRANAQIFISCMLPCKSRWPDLGWTNAQNNWLTLNSAIMNGSFTGWNKNNDYHVALMADSEGNLKQELDCGDKIHENQAGADIIIEGFRKLLGLN